MDSVTLRNLFMQTLEEYDQSYETRGDSSVSIAFDGDNLDKIEVHVAFVTTEDGTMGAVINCFDLFNFKDKLAEGLMACNQANDDELIKYYLDSDYDVVACSAVTFNAVGVECAFIPELVLTEAMLVALSVDETYPTFAKAKWA